MVDLPKTPWQLRCSKQNWKHISTRQQKQMVICSLSSPGIWCVKNSSLLSQQASAKAEVFVSPQTCPFVCVNYVSAASIRAAKVAQILQCAFESKKWKCKVQDYKIIDLEHILSVYT